MALYVMLAVGANPPLQTALGRCWRGSHDIRDPRTGGGRGRCVGVEVSSTTQLQASGSWMCG